MGRVRVQWRSVAKVAAALAAGLAALQVLPALLKAPEAPPLASDVGLPRLHVPREPAVEIREPKRRPKRQPKLRRSDDISAATATIGTTPQNRPRRRGRRGRRGELPSHTGRKSPAAPPPPAFEPPPYVPPPEPPPAPEPAPAPAPQPTPPPTDGSVEFAPH